MKTRQKRIVAAGVVVLVGVGVAGWWVLPWLKSVMPSGAERLHSAENMPGVVQRYKIKDPLKGLPTTRPGERIQLTPAELARWRAPLNWNAPGHMPAKPDWSDPITRMSVQYIALPIDPAGPIGRDLGPELCAWLKNWCQQASEGKLGDGYLMAYWDRAGKVEEYCQAIEDDAFIRMQIPNKDELNQLLKRTNAKTETLWQVARSVAYTSDLYQAKPWYAAAIRRAGEEIQNAKPNRKKALCDMVAYMMRPVFQKGKMTKIARIGFELLKNNISKRSGGGLYLRRAKFLYIETFYQESLLENSPKKSKSAGVKAAQLFIKFQKTLNSKKIPKAEWNEFDWLIGASYYSADEWSDAIPFLVKAVESGHSYYRQWAIDCVAIAYYMSDKKKLLKSWIASRKVTSELVKILKVTGE